MKKYKRIACVAAVVVCFATLCSCASSHTGKNNAGAMGGSARTQAADETGEPATGSTKAPETETAEQDTTAAQSKEHTLVTTSPVTEKTGSGTTAPPKISVGLTVQCKEAVEYIEEYKKTHGDNKFEVFENILPEDGVLYDGSGIEIKSGESVLDVFKRVMKENDIVVRLTYSGTYVAGIGGLVEKDRRYFGEQSGWLYSVDGETPDIGSAQFELKGGEEIEFRYVVKNTGM